MKFERQAMIELPTYFATIYVGSRVGYGDEIVALDKLKEVCQDYVDAVGLCITLTTTEFIYSKGNEPGVAVGLINYPRFPSDAETLINHAIELASRLKAIAGQLRVSIVAQDKTIMLE